MHEHVAESMCGRTLVPLNETDRGRFAASARVSIERALAVFRRPSLDVVRELAALREALARSNVVRTAKLCPICLAEFDDYVGFKNRARARCPSCNSLERHRTSWLYLRQRTPLFTRPTRFLHFAPEPAMRARIRGYLTIDYTATSFDPDRPAEGVDIQDLPYVNESFDLIYCSHVLEHVPDDRRAMRELRRVLAPDGLAVIMVPTRNRAKTYEDASITSPEARAKHFGRFDHLRWYGRDFVERLRDAGFRVETEYFTDTLPIADVARFGVAPEPIFACRPGG